MRKVTLLAILMAGCRADDVDAQIAELQNDIIDLQTANEDLTVRLAAAEASLQEQSDDSAELEQLSTDFDALDASVSDVDTRLTALEDQPYASEAWVNEQGYLTEPSIQTLRDEVAKNTAAIAISDEAILTNTTAVAANTAAIN
ncbi:MAG: hypothetical protein AAFV53_18985, partial [Myxococcota bacterium]